MSQWMVELIGHDFDKQNLLESNWKDIKVVEEDGAYYLQSTQFDALTEAGDVRNVAIDLVEMMNGILKVEHSHFKNVEVGHSAQRMRNDGRSPDLFVFAGAATMNVRGRLGKVLITKDGKAIEQPDKIEDWIASAWEIAYRNSNVKEALNLFSREHNAFNLYKVYEIIKADLGSRKDVSEQLGYTDAEINALTGSLNHPSVLGDDARHARLPNTPSKQITLKKAEQLIRSMLRKWIDLKR